MIKLVFIGKTKEASLRHDCNNYIDRIKRYTKVEVIEVKDEPLKKNAIHIAKQKEAERILKNVQNDYVIVLDAKGKQMDSQEFAGIIQKNEIMRKIAFIIGGPSGVDPKVIARANLLLSFSQLTMNNQIMRLVLVEQIYRAYSIIHHTAYDR
jgi:23S rRNA (pseudouridine1915-N3)-methyltransferase